MTTRDYLSLLEVDIQHALEAMPPAGRNHGGIYLTPTEIRVFRLLGLGLSNAEIEQAQNIEHSTTRTYLKRIYDKCHIAGRSRLVAVAAYIWHGGEAHV
jgi:DNA-binding CsgD family transcriptional regulator